MSQQAANAVQQSGPSSSGGIPPTPPRGSSRRESDFKAAWDLLQRSLACFLKDKAAKNGMQLPSAWNPVAWLAVYCAVVKRDSRQDSKLVAASFKAADAGLGAGAGSLDGSVCLKDGTTSLINSTAMGAVAAGARGLSGMFATRPLFALLSCSHPVVRLAASQLHSIRPRPANRAFRKGGYSA